MDFAGVVSFLPLDYISISTEASNLQSEESEYYSATLKNAMLQESSDSDPLHKSIQHDTSTSSLENMESFLTDEEVVGIITLEDVMEEILQVSVANSHILYNRVKIFLERNVSIQKARIQVLSVLMSCLVSVSMLGRFVKPLIV